MGDWVPVEASPAAPQDGGDWVPLEAAASAQPAPKTQTAGYFDGLRGFGGGLVRGLARFSADVGRGNSLEMGGTGTSTPEAAPDAAKITAAVGVNPTGEGVGNAIGETLGDPLSYVGPGGLLGKVVTGAGAAVGSELAGNLLKGSPYETAGRLIGGLAGGAAPSKAARAITPFPAEATRLGLVNDLKNEGVPVTAGEKTGNMGLRYVENYLKPDLNTPQAEAFTKAALSRAGINAERATPDVMDAAHRDIGSKFDALEARNTWHPDQQFGHDFVGVMQDYAGNVPAAARAPLVEKLGNEILSGLSQGNGTMTGQQYQALRSRLRTLGRGTADPQLKTAYNGMGSALDSSFERGLAASGSPDVGAFGEVRNQYRNLLVLDRAASANGADTMQGLISPAQLASATKALQGKTNFVRGQGDFADLARAGQGVMKPLPDSGTAWRNRLANAVKAASVGIGAGIGQKAYGSATDGGVLGLLLAEHFGEPILRQGIKHSLMNPVAQRYLGNQVLPSVPGLLQTAPLQPFTAAMSGR